MGKRIHAFPWSASVLGPIEQWPSVLTSTLSICLSAQFPMAIYWGAEKRLLYNDAWRPILGDKHPWAMGRPGREVWAEIWDAIDPLFESVRATGKATWRGDELLPMQRFGYTEECYFDYSFNPIRDQDGNVEGILNIVQETTYRVLNDCRMRLLRELASAVGPARNGNEASTLAVAALATDPADLPFALLYAIEPERRQARLIAATGLCDGSPAKQQIVDLTEQNNHQGWPFATSVQEGCPKLVDDLSARFGSLAGGIWPEPPRQALVLPIAAAGQEETEIVLVAGISPRLLLDDDYRHFLSMVEANIASAITNAKAYSLEKRRAEALAELNRAKTEFFSNVSNEFRTPLTLLLGPLEEELRERPDSPRLEVAQRNSLRLLKLVNHLLDFSRIEAGRIEARYEPTDLATLTRELASLFRSAIEKAGLKLDVNCPPLPEEAYVDREMWEKIVLNLLSNAFKFTFQGEIVVAMREQQGRIELSVRDSGVGIPPEAIPHLLERFYRVHDQRSRTHEGTGIGLALVQELVQLHGGTVRVESRVDKGSSFVITIPTGKSHLPPDRIIEAAGATVAARFACAYVEEVSRWLPAEFAFPDGTLDAPTSTPHNPDTSLITSRPKPRILVVDDNADMRQYITRLLVKHYDVIAVGDGQAALNQVRTDPPDLILSDIMMPNLDGFELVRALRADPLTKTIPVILLSARAGEEARFEGLAEGVDDYLVKPFSAGELLARIESHVKMAQTRAAMTHALRESEERFRNMADYSPMMLWVTDAEGRCTYLNQRWYEFTGQTSETGLEFGWLDALHPDDRDASGEIFRSANQRRTPFRSEYRLCRQDGEYRWAIDAAVPRLGPDGQFLGYIGSVIDITERKQAEEALRRMNDELEARVDDRTRELAASQARLRALATELNLAGQRERQRLAAELHDYLAQLLALSRIRLAQAKQQPMIPALSKTLHDVQELMDQALTYTRTLVAQLSPPVLKDFGLPMALKWLVEQMRQRDLEVSLQMDKDALPLPEDHAMLLFQSVRELLLNSIKHAGAKEARVTIREVEGWLHITVADRGTGFEVSPSLSRMKTDSPPGFGLFSIRERMLALGGRFELSSRPGQGTEAVLITPLMPREKSSELGVVSSESTESVKSSESMERRTQDNSTLITQNSQLQAPAIIRVLIADDHAMVRQGLSGLLASYADIEVIGEAANGEEAIDLALRLQPDIILMDVNMPKMDGIEATRRIRQGQPHIAIIGLSVDHSRHIELAMREAGAAAFHTKEAAVEQLYRTIEALLKPVRLVND